MDETTTRMKYEINNWRISLGTMSDENIQMKTRIAILLKENFNLNLLPQVENLYSNLLTEEEFISLLRHNVGELDNLIESDKSTFLNKDRFENMFATLKSQMRTAKIRLTYLKSEFNEFFQRETDIIPFQKK